MSPAPLNGDDAPAIILSDCHLWHRGSQKTASDLARVIGTHPGHEIIFNGDTFNLSSDAYSRDPAESVTSMVRQHPMLREALRDHLAAGFRITIIAGNHDSRVLVPSVRSAILEMFELSGHSPLEIVPWFVRRHGVHIEHGHVYDPDNAPTHPLSPSTSRSEPLGVSLMRKFFGPQDLARYARKNETPPLRALRCAFEDHGVKGPLFVARLFGVLLAVCGQSLRPGRCEPEEKRGAAELGPFGSMIGVHEQTLQSLLEGAPRPTHTSFQSTFMRLYMDRMLAAVTLPVGLLLVPTGAGPAAGVALSAASMTYLAISLSRGANRYPNRIPDHLRVGASLVRSVTGARTVLFGHTHDEHEEAGYVNSGSFGVPTTRERPFARLDKRGLVRSAFPGAC
jgi:predicted phosphodiesterase